MIVLAEQTVEDAADKFVQGSILLANSLDIITDKAWSKFDTVLKDETRKSHQAFLRLIAKLPPHRDKQMASQGFVDFSTPRGREVRLRFLKDCAKVYRAWQDNILGRLDINRWPKGAASWEKSLGILNHRGGHFLMAIRDEIVRKAHDVVSLLDHFHTDRLDTEEARLPKGFKRVTHRGVLSARLTGRGLSAKATSHSRRTSILLRGLKGVIADQEKALLENALRGLDELPAKHANALYDASTGLTLKQALNNVADNFSTGNINKRQLKLSVQTHIRAMVRRFASSASDVESLGPVQYFIQIPTMGREPPTPSERERAFKVVTLIKAQKDQMGSATGLGKFPGDRMINMVFPKRFFKDVWKAGEKALKAWLRKHPV